jgi:SPP1 gp7 family putative phage head morphogenesis protein
MRGYLDAGYTQYQFITATDNITCDECGHLNRKIFSFADAQVGVNYPPIHPNCRSNVIGYKE